MAEMGNLFVVLGADGGDGFAETITGASMKLEEPLRRAIRVKQYSLKTEEAYVRW
jgi:hypothetical protein